MRRLGKVTAERAHHACFKKAVAESAAAATATAAEAALNRTGRWRRRRRMPQVGARQRARCPPRGRWAGGCLPPGWLHPRAHTTNPARAAAGLWPLHDKETEPAGLQSPHAGAAGAAADGWLARPGPAAAAAAGPPPRLPPKAPASRRPFSQLDQGKLVDRTRVLRAGLNKAERQVTALRAQLAALKPYAQAAKQLRDAAAALQPAGLQKCCSGSERPLLPARWTCNRAC